MKLVKLKANQKYYIWAPFALLEEHLEPEKNVLLEIKDSSIDKIHNLKREELPSDIISSSNFFSFEKDITLLPSLIDAHIHLALNGIDFNQARASWSTEKYRHLIIKNAFSQLLYAGIGTVRDGGDSAGLNLEAKLLVNNGLLDGPQVIATGKAYREKGGYGSFLGEAFTSLEAIPAQVEEDYKAGVNQVKVVVSGIVGFSSYGNVKGPLISKEALKKVVSSARRHDLKVMAHASSSEAVNFAIEAGVDSIEHGYFITAESLRKMADQGIAWIPTILPVVAQANAPFSTFRTKREIEVVEKVYRRQQKMLETALEAGVCLGVGTDAGAAGVKHGTGLVEEMLLYADALAGDNKMVLQAATSVNASIVGKGKDVGAVSCGKKAGLIAVRGNPLDNLSALKNVEVHFLAS